MSWTFFSPGRRDHLHPYVLPPAHDLCNLRSISDGLVVAIQNGAHQPRPSIGSHRSRNMGISGSAERISNHRRFSLRLQIGEKFPGTLQYLTGASADNNLRWPSGGESSPRFVLLANDGKALHAWHTAFFEFTTRPSRSNDLG